MSEAGDNTPLGGMLRPWQPEMKAALAEPFQRARALATSGISILQELDVNRTMRELIVLTLWTRCIEHFEATIYLLEMGMVTPGKVAFRALVESMITINAVAKDDDVLKGYPEDDKIQQKKLMRKARESADPKYRERIDPEQEAELLKSISEAKAKEQSTLELAKKAGPDIYEWYLIVYSLLTGPAHSKIRDLEQYLSENAAGDVVFAFPRSDRDVQAVLASAGMAFIYAADAVQLVFGKGFGENRDAEQEYFYKLGDV